MAANYPGGNRFSTDFGNEMFQFLESLYRLSFFASFWLLGELDVEITWFD